MKNPDEERMGDMRLVRRGKKGTWYADFWHSGQHHRRSLGTTNVKIARQRAAKLQADLMDGQIRRRPERIAVVEAAKRFVESKRIEGRAKKTIVKYEGQLRLLANFASRRGIQKLDGITSAVIEQFRAERGKSIAPKTAWNDFVGLKSFFKWCVERNYLSNNPAACLKMRKPIAVPRGGPDNEQLGQILKSASPRLRLMLALLAFTGLRSGEMQRLLVEDVDLQHGWIHVISRAGAETKTGRSRKVPIHPALRPYLTAVRRGAGEWFFTAEPSKKYPAGGHWINTKHLNEDFQRLLKRLKMPSGLKNGGFVIHSLRHSFEAICVNAGIPQRVVDTWMGHQSDRSMASVYYKLGDKESQEFMQKVPFGPTRSAGDAGIDKEEVQ